ncbi:hypothetical protein JTB14_029377 [Gonioctena quinquepunctata]|nr:hypothetical protein JTB14_029377 [Gonioctena quinquepunctata]
MESVFTTEQGSELVSYLKSIENRLFGLIMKDFLLLAFQLAERNELSHHFSRITCLARQDWMEAFLERQPDLSIRTPESTSGARAIGFNRIAVGQRPTEAALGF